MAYRSVDFGQDVVCTHNPDTKTCVGGDMCQKCGYNAACGNTSICDINDMVTSLELPDECKACARIGCDYCKIKEKRDKTFVVSSVSDITLYDHNGNIIPKEQYNEKPEEEPDWRKDYAKYKETNK